MKLINMTSKKLILWNEEKSEIVKTVEAESVPLRVININCGCKKMDEICMHETKNVLNVGLPPKKANVLYIVSQKVMEFIRCHYPERNDFVTVDVDRYGIKTADGKILGTTANFIRIREAPTVKRVIELNLNHV